MLLILCAYTASHHCAHTVLCSPRPLGSAAAKVRIPCTIPVQGIRGHSVDILTQSCVPINRGASHRLCRIPRHTAASDPGDGGQASFRSPLASPSAWRRRRLEIESTGLRFRGSTWEWRHSFDIITCPGPPPRVSEWLKSRCSGSPPRVSERLKSRCPGASQRMSEWLKPRCPGPHAALLLCLISDIRTQRNAEPPLPSPCSGHPLPRHPSSFGFPSGIIR